MDTDYTGREAWVEVIGMILAEGGDGGDLLPDALLTLTDLEARLSLMAAIQIGGQLVRREAAGEGDADHPIINYLVSCQNSLSA